MTINETSFFRDNDVFAVLQHSVVPELVRQRSHFRCLNIWSASCSSGQEPFSIAMLLRQHFPDLAGWNLRLIASDLSNRMLERARRGVYSDLAIFRGLSTEFRDAFFQKGEHGWQIHDDLRRMVEF
jgi:chemotaxis protein methyltransferase CheR